MTDQNRNAKSRRDYCPYGEELGSGIGGRTGAMGYGQADGLRQKFTQKERDTESGLDYFLARYYSGAQGRFTSVDPANVGASREHPQTWNGYSYAINNPLMYLDPDGLKVVICDANGNCVTLTDEEANKSIFNKKHINSIGFTVKKGKIFDEKGEQVGTYKRISFDDLTDKENEVIFGLAARASAMNQAIVTFGVGTAVAGATGGTALYVSGVMAGNGLTTLGIGAATEGTTGITAAATLAPQAASAIRNAIAGFTKHGINSAISHDAVGVSTRAILDALKNPIKVMIQSGGRVRIEGKDATVILNQAGKVITTWARTSAGTRIEP